MPDVIQTHRLTKYYDGHCAVDSLDLRVAQGTVYGLLGRNGAGKTTAIKMLLGMAHPSYGRAEVLGEDSAHLRPEMIAVFLFSVVLAALCYRRQHQYGLPWTGVWTAFVLLFGLPAYFGYLAHRSWPARLACPNCGKRVPRDRPACTGCGQEFPPPQPKGIEVFA